MVSSVHRDPDLPVDQLMRAALVAAARRGDRPLLAYLDQVRVALCIDERVWTMVLAALGGAAHIARGPVGGLMIAIRRRVAIEQSLPRGCAADAINAKRAQQAAAGERLIGETPAGDVALPSAASPASGAAIATWQKALILAMVYPDKGNPGGHGNEAATAAREALGLDRERVRCAREVAAYDDLRDLVLSGRLRFTTAVAEARRRRAGVPAFSFTPRGPGRPRISRNNQ